MALNIEFQGRLVKARGDGKKRSPWERTPVRGIVACFSKRSRKRMLELVARLDDKSYYDNPVRFITLTYPWLMTDGKRAKRDLQTFVKRLRRIAPEMSGIWRMELQKRGSIHFHVMAWGLPFVDNLTVRQWWSEVIGFVGYPLNTDIRRLKSVKQMFYYVAKYMGKPSHLDTVPYLTEFGRWWGMINRPGLPYAALVVIIISHPVTWYWNVKRAVRKLIPGYTTKSRDSPGFTLFSSHVSQWYDYVELLMLS